MTPSVATLSALRDAVNLANLIAASDNAGDRTLNVPPARFKFDLIKGHTKTARPDLFGISAIVEIDISKTKIVSFCSDCASAGANGLTFCLSV